MMKWSVEFEAKYVTLSGQHVLCLFMTDLNRLGEVSHLPAGYFIAPKRNERERDVSNIVGRNGWICNNQDDQYIYYASADTSMHVATTKGLFIDYVANTKLNVEDRNVLISNNREILRLNAVM